MTKPIPRVARELEGRVEELGYELVTAEWKGTRVRPILRLRVDLPGARIGEGVTVGQCAEVSRRLERWLDAVDEVPPSYVLEVSSPGVDRPIVRRSDWSRFSGSMVAVSGRGILAGRATYLEGEILRVEGGDRGCERVRLRLVGGEEVKIAVEEIAHAHLLFTLKS